MQHRCSRSCGSSEARSTLRLSRRLPNTVKLPRPAHLQGRALDAELPSRDVGGSVHTQTQRSYCICHQTWRASSLAMSFLTFFAFAIALHAFRMSRVLIFLTEFMASEACRLRNYHKHLFGVPLSSTMCSANAMRAQARCWPKFAAMASWKSSSGPSTIRHVSSTGSSRLAALHVRLGAPASSVLATRCSDRITAMPRTGIVLIVHEKRRSSSPDGATDHIPCSDDKWLDTPDSLS